MGSNKKPCKVGHLWGKWKQDPVACVGVRVCHRCGQEEERERHVWGTWTYQATGACRQRRLCTRCGKTESQTAHVFETWRYRRPDSCQQTRPCARCGQEETRVRHKWGKWEYEAPDVCQQIRVCGRCQLVERQVHHIWGKKDSKSGYSICERCEEKDVYEARPCPKCGAHRLVYDGMLVWRSGPRPPRKLARKNVRFSHRADMERERCYHCEACGAEFFQDMETRRSHLYEEAAAEKLRNGN